MWGGAPSSGLPVPLASSLPPAVPGSPAEPARGQRCGQPDGGQRAPGAWRGVRVREHSRHQVPRAREDRGAPWLLPPHCQGLAGRCPALGVGQPDSHVLRVSLEPCILVPPPPLGSCGA